MDNSNLATLTKSHRAIAGKKRARREQIKEVLFDDDARREFLTGFHKRKLQKKEDKKKKREEREHLEKLEIRREHRRTLAERAAQNAAEVERAYGANVDDEDEWEGASPSLKKGKRKAEEIEEEYEDEEQLATVTVVEDFDPETLIYGPSRTLEDHSTASLPTSSVPPTRSKPPIVPPSNVKPLKSTTAKAKASTKTKKIKYQTAAARKSDKRKQLARHTEKAERAGGKQRKRPGAGKRR